MEPINPQNMRTQSSSGAAASQLRVHGYWNGRPVDKNGAVVMIPTPGMMTNSNCNDEKPAPGNHHVVTNPAANNTSNCNDVQYAAYGDRLGVKIPKPNNAYTNVNWVQPAAQSRQMGTPNNLQSTVVNIPNAGTTSTGNALQAKASQANFTGNTGSLKFASGIASNTFFPAGSNSGALSSRVNYNNMTVSSRPVSQQQDLLPADAPKQKNMEDRMVAKACVTQFKNYLRDWDRCSENNASENWKTFVAHYYAPEAKRLHCQAVLLGLSADNYRCNSQGTPTCGHCQIKSNKSQEVSFPELAISFQHKFLKYKKDQFIEHGQLRAWKAGNNTVLYLNDVVEIAANDQFVYLWKGRLAVEFKADMKILNWQFCVSTCERADRSDAIACSKLKQMLQHAGGSSKAGGSQPTSCQETRNQPVSNSMYPGTSGANVKEVNLPVAPPPLTNSANRSDTCASASGIRPVTINPTNAMMNSLPAAHHDNARSLRGRSDLNNKKRKQAASTEFAPVEITPANKNIGLSVAKPEHWSGIEILDTSWDLVELEILESLVHSTASVLDRSASS